MDNNSIALTHNWSKEKKASPQPDQAMMKKTMDEINSAVNNQQKEEAVSLIKKNFKTLLYYALEPITLPAEIANKKVELSAIIRFLENESGNTTVSQARTSNPPLSTQATSSDTLSWEQKIEYTLKAQAAFIKSRDLDQLNNASRLKGKKILDFLYELLKEANELLEHAQNKECESPPNYRQIKQAMIDLLKEMTSLLASSLAGKDKDSEIIKNWSQSMGIVRSKEQDEQPWTLLTKTYKLKQQCQETWNLLGKVNDLEYQYDLITLNNKNTKELSELFLDTTKMLPKILNEMDKIVSLALARVDISRLQDHLTPLISFLSNYSNRTEMIYFNANMQKAYKGQPGCEEWFRI
jgi:hypothetical protein